MYIKYLYFKYSDTDDTDKKSFIKTVNHRLNEAWTNVKPHVVPLLAKLNSSLDLTLFDDFIDEIDSFDTDSFRMRYPIKKDLATVHNTVVKLNVIGLHAKMLDFYKMFDDLDNELDGVFLNNKKDFFKLIELSLKECDHFISFEGNHTNYEMCYALFEKSYSVSSIWLNKSLDIMEKCIIDG